MAAITTVLPTDTFKLWRERTNQLIGIFNMPFIGNVLQLSTRTETFDITESAGVHIGCVVTDANPGVDATVNITAGEAMLRTLNLSSSPLTSVELTATNGLALTAAATNFIYADYNAGTPIIAATTLTTVVNGRNTSLIAVVQVSPTFGKTILQIGGESGDFENRITHRLQATEGFRKATGADMVEAGTRNLQISAGEFYYGVAEVLSSPLDTTAADQFEYYWKNSAGNWVETLASAFDNLNVQTFGIGTGTTPMTASWFRTDWIYLKIGGNKTTCYVVMGENEYATASEAKQDTPPQALHFPPALDTLGVLIGRAVIQQGAVALVSLDSTLNNANFAASGAVEFADNGFRIFDDAAPSKKGGFDAAGIGTGVTRIYKMPNKNGTMAMLEDIRPQFDEPFKISSQGSLSKRVIPYDMTIAWGAQESETTITKNGITEVSNVPKNAKGLMVVLKGDIIEANNPVSMKDSIDGNVIAPLNTAQDHFWFYSNRFGPHEVSVYAPFYDITIIYKKDSTNFAVSDNVWDPAINGETNVIKVDQGTVKNFFVQYDPASPAGPIPNVNPVSQIGNHYFHSNGPMVVTKEGQAADQFLVMPMSREILFPSATATGAKYTASFTGAPITHVGSGYYISDDLMQAQSLGDGAGNSGHTGIPFEMCGDSYHIEHDIAGYQLLAIEAGDIRVFVNGEKYADIDMALASRTNPIRTTVGSTSSGVPSLPSLDITVGYIEFNYLSGTFQVGETVTQAVSAATGTIANVDGERINVVGITGTFDATNTLTGGTSAATATPTALPYCSWTFEGSAPFALRVNDPVDDEYVPVGFRRTMRDYSFDLTKQLNRDLHTLADEVQERAPFTTNFDPDLDYEWTNHAGTGTIVNNDASAIAGASGANVRSAVGQRWDIYGEKIAFNPSILYKVSAKIRLSAAPTTPGTALAYIGVAGIASDGVTFVNTTGANSYGSQYYVAANGRNLETDGVNTWVTVTGYFKGHGTTFGAASDPLVPSNLHANARFFKPLVSLNYPNGDGTTEIDWLRIEEMEADAQNAQEVSDRTNADNILQTNIDTTNTNLTAHTTAPHQPLVTSSDVAATAITVSGDWNSQINGGFFMGTALTNSPAATGAHPWRYVTVVRYSATWVVQYMTDFNNAASWTRVLINGAWPAWKRLDPGEHAALATNPHNVTIAQVTPLTVNGDIMYRSGGATTRLPLGTSTQVMRSNGTVPYWTDLIVAATEQAGPSAGTAFMLAQADLTRTATGTTGWITMKTWTYTGATGAIKLSVRSKNVLNGYSSAGRILHNGISVLQAATSTYNSAWGAWSNLDRIVTNGDILSLSVYGYNIQGQAQAYFRTTAPSGYSMA